MSSVFLLAVLGTAAVASGQSPPRPPAITIEPGDNVKLYPPEPARAAPARPAPAARPDMVLRWNSVALHAIRTERTPPPLAARNLAMVHIAIYDAVNAIYRTHEIYRVRIVAGAGASPAAAVAGAAHHVLVDLYPKQREALDAALRETLADLPGGAPRAEGLNLGRAVAEQVLAWRRGDGADNPGRFTPRTVPGQWRPTPAAFKPALLPAWGAAEPFAIKKGTQLRPPGPPALTSAAYTAAFLEVKRLGGKDSLVRTAEQTQIAYFWADGDGTETPPGHWNRIAQGIAVQRSNSLLENARLFALLNVSLADAGILCWVIKFHFAFWRPVTAIERADEDGNPDTTPDPTWVPLLPTPPFPAYTSGHSTFSGAGAAVLIHCFGGERLSFSTTSDGLPGVTRSFNNIWDAAEEAGQSRIYGGIHWQFDNRDGLAVGRHLGEYVCRSFFRPRPPRNGGTPIERKPATR
jgi:hypothetical protein